jgi:hypothetical protein
LLCCAFVVSSQFLGSRSREVSGRIHFGFEDSDIIAASIGNSLGRLIHFVYVTSPIAILSLSSFRVIYFLLLLPYRRHGILVVVSSSLFGYLRLDHLLVQVLVVIVVFALSSLLSCGLTHFVVWLCCCIFSIFVVLKISHPTYSIIGRFLVIISLSYRRLMFHVSFFVERSYRCCLRSSVIVSLYPFSCQTHVT